RYAVKRLYNSDCVSRGPAFRCFLSQDATQTQPRLRHAQVASGCIEGPDIIEFSRATRSSSRNVVSFSSACTTKPRRALRCASIIKTIRQDGCQLANRSVGYPDVLEALALVTGFVVVMCLG